MNLLLLFSVILLAILYLFKYAKLILTCRCKQKKVQLLNSGIEECQTLKSNYIQKSKIGRREPQLDDGHLQSCSNNLEGECQVYVQVYRL